MTTHADDPIRADVERALRRVVDVTVVAPWLVATWVPRCVVRRLGALASSSAPRAAVRTVVDLAQHVTSPSESSISEAPVTEAVAGTTAPSATDLPIEDYESLAASQVVTRLDALDADGLRAVRGFEVAHRGRRTILGKIDQLLA